MAGTGYTSADLLSRFNAMAGRPSSGDSITDAQKYQRLADAQDAVVADIANICGKVLYSSPVAMTTSDGGLTYTFGTDGNGYALFPFAARVYPTLSAVPDFPWQPGVDYLDHGTSIAMPNNVPWTGGLYWQGITPPQQLAASVEPVVTAPPMRILIVIKAALNFSEEAKRDPELASVMAAKYKEEFARWSVVLRKHLRGRRTLGPLAGGAGFGGALFGGRVW